MLKNLKNGFDWFLYILVYFKESKILGALTAPFFSNLPPNLDQTNFYKIFQKFFKK